MTSTGFVYRRASVTNSMVIASPWWFKQMSSCPARSSSLLPRREALGRHHSDRKSRSKEKPPVFSLNR